MQLSLPGIGTRLSRAEMQKISGGDYPSQCCSGRYIFPNSGCSSECYDVGYASANPEMCRGCTQGPCSTTLTECANSNFGALCCGTCYDCGIGVE